MTLRHLLLAIVAIPSMLCAQKPEQPKWDVSNPPGPFHDAAFTVDEGTWMNIDVSPDGTELVFDLLGDIYSLPIAGGTARVLRSGYPFEVQPRYSPDGKFISFTSDAGGGDNIWIMNRDGSGAKQVTKEDFRLLNNAVWVPGGDYLVARKHFTSTRSLGAGELWMYHRTGGEGVQLTKRKNDQQDLGEPCYSPDGKYIYYSEDMYPGGFFQYNKDPNAQVYAIKRFDTGTGESEQVTGGAGGAVRPQVSRDGTRLAFVRRVREQSVLFIRDLKTGEEWPLNDSLSKDQQEAWAIFGVYPNFNWMPGDHEIVIWAQGKIRRIDVQKGTSAVIPFTAACNHRITDAVRFQQVAAPDSFDLKAIRHTVTSPDGSYIVFNAAGYLWKKMLPSGVPGRITNGTDFEFEPTFSPDGKQLVYVTWNDEHSGAIQILDPRKNGTTPVRITKEKGIFRTPCFSPDGKQVIFQKEEGNDAQGFAFTVKPGIYIVPASGGDAVFVTKNGEQPMFSPDGKRVYYFSSENDKKSLISILPDGGDMQVLLTSKYASMIVPSPDNKWVAFTDLFKVFVSPFLPSGRPMELVPGGKAFPVALTARDNGLSLHWTRDSKNLCWTSGDQYFKTPLSERFNFLPGSPDSVGSPDTTGISIGLRLPFNAPSGKLAFTNARIITMNGTREVIERGTLVTDRNRIIAIGKTGSVPVPDDALVIDGTGKTIMPGIIDVHAHLGTFRQGLSPQKQWSYYANLAYGVTTTHDPSSNSEMVFSQSEMVKAGIMNGPRIFSTGWILYGAEGDYKAVINKREDALSAIRRTTSFGAFSVKSYNQPRRDQRQMVIDAARQLHVNVVPEGGSFFFHNLSMILDGHTGIEHNLPVAPLYNDVISLWAASKTGYTPTLIVCYGGMMGENYFYQKTNVWENEKLLRFTPRFIIDARSRHRTMIPDKEFENGHILVSKSCKALADKGVRVNLGAHGQLQGLGAHWELWMLSQGGMTNMQALECATVNGAYYIGMENDLGSLEKGKLADFIVLDKNPLDDIRNSESIRYTIANGRMFDSATLDELGNHPQKRGLFYWEQQRSGNSFPWHMETDGDGD